MNTQHNISCDDFADMPQLLTEAVRQIEERMIKRNGITGIMTGFDDLDRFTFGLQCGDLIVLAGRPSMGENILALNIAEHVALNAKLPVAIFDMDRGMNNLAMQLLASNAKVNCYDLRQGRVNNEQSERISESVEVLKVAPIYISKTAAVSVQEVSARLRNLKKMTGGLGLAIVDCLPELKLTGEMADKVTAHEIATISRHFKALAMKLNTPMIVLSPINRDLEERFNKRPYLVDLPCGGAVACAAGLVLFIYRDNVYDVESKDQGMAEIIVAKNTHGAFGSFLLKYNEQHPRFENVI